MCMKVLASNMGCIELKGSFAGGFFGTKTNTMYDGSQGKNILRIEALGQLEHIGDIDSLLRSPLRSFYVCVISSHLGQ